MYPLNTVSKEERDGSETYRVAVRLKKTRAPGIKGIFFKTAVEGAHLLYMIVALFAAFPQELYHICKTRPSVQQMEGGPFPVQGNQHRSCEIVATQTGMGAANVETAFWSVLQERHPDVVLSAGFGGALYENAGIGDIVWSSRSLLIGGDRTQRVEHVREDAVPDSTFVRRLGKKLG